MRCVPVVPVLIAVGLTMLVSSGRSALAEEPAPQEQTIQAEVVDPAAYLKDGKHGASQADQTYEAADNGQTLALLEDPPGNLYLLLAENPGDDPDALVYDYVNQKVAAKGRVYVRGGVRGMVLTTVDPMEPAENASAGAATNPSVEN